jgi:hypothetical protein
VSKAHLKRSQLPVTARAPYVCEPIPAGDLNYLVPVLDPLGSFLFWADEELARSLIKAGQVRICRTKRKIRALQAITSLDNVPPHKRCIQKKLFGLPHRRETETNPAGVWTQDALGYTHSEPGTLMPIDNARAKWARRVCTEVLLSCLKKAA